MKTNDRVRSEYNEGTVKNVENGIVTVHWDGFAWPCNIRADQAEGFEVVGSVDPYCGMISGDDDLDEPAPHAGIYSSDD